MIFFKSYIKIALLCTIALLSGTTKAADDYNKKISYATQMSLAQKLNSNSLPTELYNTFIQPCLQQWKWQLSDVLYEHNNDINNVHLLQNGTTLASSDGNTIIFWDTKTGTLQRKLPGGANIHITHTCFSPDEQIIAAAISNSHSIRLLNTSTGMLIRTLQGDNGHTDWINAVSFSPNGQIIASASEDCTIKLWNASTGEIIHTIQEHTDNVTHICFAPNGQTIASSSEDETIRIWNVNTGEQITALNGHTNSICNVCFSPDGQILASSSDDETVQLWDTTTYNRIAELQGHTSSTYALCFSPDNKILASTSDDRTIRIWDTTTHEQIAVLHGHTNFITSVCFSPDGSMLASGSDDQTIRLWSLTHGIPPESHKEIDSLIQKIQDDRHVAGYLVDFDKQYFSNTSKKIRQLEWLKKQLPEEDEEKNNMSDDSISTVPVDEYESD